MKKEALVNIIFDFIKLHGEHDTLSLQRKFSDQARNQEYDDSAFAQKITATNRDTIKEITLTLKVAVIAFLFQVSIGLGNTSIASSLKCFFSESS